MLRSCNAQDFGYDGEKGPSHWGEQYNTCFGKHQSPININSLTVKQRNLPPLKLSGFDLLPNQTTITNNGHTGNWLSLDALFILHSASSAHTVERWHTHTNHINQHRLGDIPSPLDYSRCITMQYFVEHIQMKPISHVNYGHLLISTSARCANVETVNRI